MPETDRGTQAEHVRPAARLIALILAAAALAVVVGSCLWAWASDDFWESVPLYPSAAAAGTLAGLALYVGRGQLLRAAALTLMTSFITLLGTAIITLARWGN
jgi:hypothetical protein